MVNRSDTVALRALNRFGLGARPGQSRMGDDPRGWLRAQLDAPVETLQGVRGIPSAEEVGTALRELREAQRARDQDQARAARRKLQEIVGREAEVALTERVRSARPFAERLVAFWSNHLCVSVAGNPGVAVLAGAYERDAIRPNALGKYEDLVLASARHPAMLLYLDNAQSMGPSSRIGSATRRRQRQARGLNENYARELLELHTVGVDGGYSQADVESLAKILTGWTVEGIGARRQGRRDARDVPAFRFVPEMHEPGSQTVLGTRYEDEGQRAGEDVIRDLCRHPATAVFVSRKLVMHFVSDEPAEADVNRVAGVFRETDGHLRAVARTLVDLESAWHPENGKFRSPQDWLVAGLRAFGGQDYPSQLVPLLRALRHPLWAPASPKGFGDTRWDWADPDGLMNRAELARTLARQVGRRGFEPGRLLDTVAVRETSPLPNLLADESIDRGERIALFLSGPDFQWR